MTPQEIEEQLRAAYGDMTDVILEMWIEEYGSFDVKHPGVVGTLIATLLVPAEQIFQLIKNREYNEETLSVADKALAWFGDAALLESGDDQLGILRRALKLVEEEGGSSVKDSLAKAILVQNIERMTRRHGKEREFLFKRLANQGLGNDGLSKAAGAYTLATSLTREKRFLEAWPHFLEAIRGSFANRSLQGQSGVIGDAAETAAQIGQIDNAIALSLLSVDVSKDPAEDWLRIVRCLLNQMRLLDARKAIKQARHQGYCSRAMVWLEIEACIRLQNYEEVLKLLDEHDAIAIAEDGEITAGSYGRRCQVYRALGDEEKSSKYAELCLAKWPTNPLVWQTRFAYAETYDELLSLRNDFEQAGGEMDLEMMVFFAVGIPDPVQRRHKFQELYNLTSNQAERERLELLAETLEAIGETAL
ncbi:MAG: hypothetical protein AAFN91_10310 [Pseudomonadota bacterium]